MAQFGVCHGGVDQPPRALIMHKKGVKMELMKFIDK
jgi:hypothetical protein